MTLGIVGMGQKIMHLGTNNKKLGYKPGAHHLEGCRGEEKFDILLGHANDCEQRMKRDCESIKCDQVRFS